MIVVNLRRMRIASWERGRTSSPPPCLTCEIATPDSSHVNKQQNPMGHAHSILAASLTTELMTSETLHSTMECQHTKTIFHRRW